MRGFRNRSRRKKYRRPDPHPDVSVPKNTRLYEELEANINELREQFGHSTDLMIRFAEMGKEPQIDVAVVYMDGLVNEQAVSQFVMHTLLIDSAGQQGAITRETDPPNFQVCAPPPRLSMVIMPLPTKKPTIPSDCRLSTLILIPTCRPWTHSTANPSYRQSWRANRNGPHRSDGWERVNRSPRSESRWRRGWQIRTKQT